ncbi:hypothetical protein FDECE_9011 [Fusarium decemcellulare]|nr:hypothetical protein FDECE_9011 [Fusarium decemcellulare]
MSGFEIAGVVLGAIPIVLEAYDRYHGVSKAFAFRQHSRELTRLDAILNAQKTIFRSDVTKLLIAVTNDPEKARSLLSGEDQCWDDLGIHGLASSIRPKALHDAFNSWKDTLDEIHHSLQSICSEVESFRVSSAKTAQTLSMDSVKQLRKQFRLCFKKEQVQDAIEDLRNFTADFNQLTTRVIDELKDLDVEKCTSEHTIARTKPSYWNSLDMYRQIRAASSSLYETFAFRWSCSVHQRHVASITVQNGKEPFKTGEGITFEALVTPSEAETSPLWLEIECIDEKQTCQLPSRPRTAEELESDQAWSTVVDTLKKHSQPLALEPVVQRTPKKLTKRPKTSPNAASTGKVVRFQTPSSEPDDIVDAAGSEKDSTQTDDTQLTNLDIVEDVCQHFQTTHSSCESLCDPTCVGYIQHSGLHRFYMPVSQPFPSSSQMSLAEMISWIVEDDLYLPRSARADIASSLACAVLQYHSTPWLPETWQSSHVRFFGIKDWLDDSSNLSLRSPYFKVEFSKADIKGKEKAANNCLPANHQYAVVKEAVRNEVLFSFGLVLLELGYSKPWNSLRSRVLSKLPLTKQVDYHAAEKLAQSPQLRDQMGPRYSTIIRKCLGCDFGLGENDLENEELQGTFLVDVVNALQEAAGGLRELEGKLYSL